jgi:ribonuclease VapC
VTLLEAVIVMSNKKPSTGRTCLYELVLAAGIETVAFDNEQMRKAIEAYLNYGKGRSPAALNLGDCISYALAVVKGEPLLFKGGDFANRP